MVKLKSKTKRKWLITAVVCLLVIAIFLFFQFVLPPLKYGNPPKYERTDIKSLLEKSNLSDDDYRTLFLQTGIGKSGVDGVHKRGLNEYKKAMLKYQD